MPTKALTLCSYPGCRQLPCPGHKKEAQRLYDKWRGSASSRGYGHLWRKVRAQVLNEEPFCRECMKNDIVKATTDIDHITPKEQGGTSARENLQGLCHECHSAKTARQDRGFGNARR